MVSLRICWPRLSSMNIDVVNNHHGEHLLECFMVTLIAYMWSVVHCTLLLFKAIGETHSGVFSTVSLGI